jgi:hypothetical protein
MFIPEPGSEHFPFRIPDQNFPILGSRTRISSIPDPGSASKNLSIFTPKNCFYDQGCSSQTTDPGFENALDPGSETAALADTLT